MSLYREADAGHLAKLDEAEGRGFSIDQINALQDRYRTTRRVFRDTAAEEEARQEWLRQEAEESPEAEWERHQYRMRLRAAELDEVWYSGRPGIDTRCHDVGGYRSVAGL